VNINTQLSMRSLPRGSQPADQRQQRDTLAIATSVPATPPPAP
jgi:hypothetical protein